MPDRVGHDGEIPGQAGDDVKGILMKFLIWGFAFVVNDWHLCSAYLQLDGVSGLGLS